MFSEDTKISEITPEVVEKSIDPRDHYEFCSYGKSIATSKERKVIENIYHASQSNSKSAWHVIGGKKYIIIDDLQRKLIREIG